MRKDLVRKKWETACSDLKELYGVSLLVDTNLTFTVSDRVSVNYEFTFPVSSVHMLADESLRAEIYNDEGPVGRTFIIANSDLLELLNPSLVFMNYGGTDRLTHYVICTWDMCLEVLSEEPPVIRQIPIAITE